LNTLATRILLCQGSDGHLTAYGVEIAPGAALPVAGNFEGKQDLVVRSVMARQELSGIGNSTELSEFGIETVVDLPGVGSNLQGKCANHDELSIIWKLEDNFKLYKGCTFLSNTAQDPCLQDW
ncbi:hypothetical protein C8R44DRAFT_565771, partial [Mycena epipterygia]